jgi:hypothetical protein
LFRFVMEALLGNVQVAPVGKAELQEIETASGKLSDPFTLGVTVAVYAAGAPATTVAVFGETSMAKSVTLALALAVAVGVEPKDNWALFDNVPAVVGVRLTVIEVVCPAFSAPRLQTRVAGLVFSMQFPGTVPSVPPVRKSVKIALDTKSPEFMMVYLKATVLPTPTIAGVTVAAAEKIRVPSGPSLLTKASVPVPFLRLPWKAAAVGKSAEAVSPAT